MKFERYGPVILLFTVENINRLPAGTEKSFIHRKGSEASILLLYLITYGFYSPHGYCLRVTHQIPSFCFSKFSSELSLS